MKRVALALAFIFWASAAFAQYAGVRVVNSCGTPDPWPALQTVPFSQAGVAWMTVDTNMVLCVNATLTGSISIGTVAQGASGSAGDAWYVRPGSGGFAISNTGFNALQAGSANTSVNPFYFSCVGGTCAGGGGGASGFTPSFVYSAPLSVTNTSASTTLPAGTTTGSVINVYNRGPAPFFWTAAASPTATTSMAQLQAGACASFVVPAGVTSIAAITSATSLSATLNTELGTGTPSLGCAGNPQVALGVTYPTTGVAAFAKSSSNTAAALSLDVSGNLLTGGAAGAFVSGSFVSGALADGAIATIGTQADVAWASGSGTEIAILKKIAGNTNSISATFTSFAPVSANDVSLAVTSTSARVVLPAGTVVNVTNKGSNTAYVALGSGSVVATAANIAIAPGGGGQCFAVGANVDLAAIADSGNTTTLNLSGGAGGCAGWGGGGGTGGTSVPADTTLSSTGTISAANVYGTGLTVATWAAGGTPTLTGTPTANSALSFTAFSGWNTGYLECTGGGTVGTNWFEVDRTATTGIWKRLATWTGPANAVTINLAGAVAVNVVAAQYASGTLACTMRVSVNYATPDAGNMPLNGELNASISMTTATTTQIVAAVPGLPIYITGWNEFVSNTASVAPSWTFAYGTGTNCATGLTALSLAGRTLAANNGIVRSGSTGAQLIVPPGNALCATVTVAPTSGSLGIDVSYAQ